MQRYDNPAANPNPMVENATGVYVLFDDADALQTEIAGLHNQIDLRDGQIADLQGQLATLGAQIQSLQSECVAKSAQVTTYATQIAEMRTHGRSIKSYAETLLML